MIIVRQFSEPADYRDAPKIIVELPYDSRKKSRLRVMSRCGHEVGIQLPRGSELLHGQRLLAESGEVVEIVARAEILSTVTSPNPLLLTRAAYHLGNRHMPLQVGEGWLRYQHDHVLDDMVRGLGLEVRVETAPFQPESGAYHRGGEGGHHHHHDDADGHGHHHHSDHHHDQ